MPKQSDLPPEPTILPLPKEERGSRGKPEKPSKPKAQTQPRTSRKQRTSVLPPIPSNMRPQVSAIAYAESDTSRTRTEYAASLAQHAADGELLERDEEPPTRARTTGGNGYGWGGPAKGLRTAEEARELKEIYSKPLPFNDFPEEARRMYGLWWNIANDDGRPDEIRMQASRTFVEHVQGKAISRILETPNGETVDEVRIVDASSLSPEERAVLRKVLQEKLAERAPKSLPE